MVQVLRFIDGFDHYGDSQLSQKWDTVLKDSYKGVDLVGRNSTRGFRVAGGSGVRTILGKNIPGGSAQDLVAGIAYKWSEINSLAQGWLFGFLDTFTYQVALKVNDTTGKIELRRGGGGANFGTLLATSANAPALGVWHYLELALHVADAGGTCVVHMTEEDGSMTEIINFTGDTQVSGNASANVFRLGDNDQMGTSMFVDDIYVATGGLTMYGNSYVRMPRASGAGALTELATTPTVNWKDTREVAPDSDTSYISSSTPGHRDLYAHTALRSGDVPRGVQITVSARKDDGAARQIASLARSGGSNFVGATKTMAATYAMYQEMLATNPATGLAWTEAEVNAAEFGVQVIA